MNDPDLFVRRAMMGRHYYTRPRFDNPLDAIRERISASKLDAIARFRRQITGEKLAAFDAWVDAAARAKEIRSAIAEFRSAADDLPQVELIDATLDAMTAGLCMAERAVRDAATYYNSLPGDTNE